MHIMCVTLNLFNFNALNFGVDYLQIPLLL